MGKLWSYIKARPNLVTGTNDSNEDDFITSTKNNGKRSLDVFSRADWQTEVEKLNIDGHSMIHKFGAATNITATVAPITSSGLYRTPLSATALEIVSTSANDATAGSGAQSVKVEGLDANWDAAEETITLSGTTPNTLTTAFTRVHRLKVVQSGTYASQASPSHNSTITLRETNTTTGSDVWSEINTIDSFGLSQSLIGAYSVPRNKIAVFYDANVNLEANKAPSIFFFVRENINDVTTPYTGVMQVRALNRSPGSTSYTLSHILDTVQGPADVGFMAKIDTGTLNVDVQFEFSLTDISLTGY